MVLEFKKLSCKPITDDTPFRIGWAYTEIFINRSHISGWQPETIVEWVPGEVDFVEKKYFFGLLSKKEWLQIEPDRYEPVEGISFTLHGEGYFTKMTEKGFLEWLNL